VWRRWRCNKDACGELIHRRVTGKSHARSFRYFDKAAWPWSQGFAVLQTGKILPKRLSGVARVGSCAPRFLAQASLRVSVFVQWVWTGLTEQRGSSSCESLPAQNTGRAAADAPHEAMGFDSSDSFKSRQEKTMP